MRVVSFAVLTICLYVVSASILPRSVVESRDAYYAPIDGGGSELIYFPDNDDGEPLNVIISGLSSADVLTDAGFLNYVRALGFSEECLDIHLGDPAAADLGDGNGWVNQTAEYRWDYGDVLLGTCLETLIGGNHLRYYRQNGSEADTAYRKKRRVQTQIPPVYPNSNKEQDLEEDHTIVPNGYDIGRDELVSIAEGTTSYGGVTYSTTAENITGLLSAGSAGIDHDIYQDGIVTLLTVTIE
ncbi:hypothetical protein FISHEDRAFT_55004 [Fistulina hepatica ATCC 64428]|uniref:Uncharacterized protein n=1 Tax=Fistulina hepatica ATCC 64428 TaxID=1128425 RepID=A0A0D7AQ92_9AGAR|nr:hypothetical protein FISHEDRAFT_55004 [Fistulina hepatica ATCC 64428]